MTAQNSKQNACILSWRKILATINSKSRPFPSRQGHRRKLLLARGESETRAVSVLSQWDALPESEGMLASVKKRQIFLDQPIMAGGRKYFVKVYVYKDLPRVLESLFYLSDAQRNYTTLEFLKACGVSVTPPLGLVHEYRAGIVTRSFLMLEGLDRAEDYKEYLHKVDVFDTAARQQFFHSLGTSLGMLHKAQVFTKDTDKNTMVEERGKTFRFHFLDFDSTFPWRVPNYRRTVINFKKYLTPGHRIEEQDIERFVAAYCLQRDVKSWQHALLESTLRFFQENRNRYL